MILDPPYNWLYRLSGPKGGVGPVFRIIAWTQGEAPITPKATRTPIVIPIVRIWIQRLDRPTRAPYYDISAVRLQGQLIRYLATQSYVGKQFSVRAYGRKPRKVHGLNVEPIPG